MTNSHFIGAVCLFEQKSVEVTLPARVEREGGNASLRNETDRPGLLSSSQRYLFTLFLFGGRCREEEEYCFECQQQFGLVVKTVTHNGERK